MSKLSLRIKPVSKTEAKEQLEANLKKRSHTESPKLGDEVINEEIIPKEMSTKNILEHLKLQKVKSIINEADPKEIDPKMLNLLDPDQLAEFIGFSPAQCMSTVSQVDGVLAREDKEFREKSKSKYMKLIKRKNFRKASSNYQ